MKKSSVLLALAAIVLVAGCTSKQQIEKAIQENPDIVFNAIKANPKRFVEVVNEAVQNAQATAREDQAKQEQDRMDAEFKSPKAPVIQEGRVIFGNKSAPITIVEYSDFQCPYCQQGYMNIKEVMKMYGDKVRVVFKHLPLDFHPMAMPASKYFEAIAMQDHAKAEKFHDEVFANQKMLTQEGEKFLDKAAKKVGADMAKLKKDLTSSAITERIEADMEEAKKFEFSGTPGFLVNGVSLRGAYPPAEFKKIIDRHLEGKGS